MGRGGSIVTGNLAGEHRRGRGLGGGEVGVGVVDGGGGLATVFGGKDISWGRGGGVRDVTSYRIKIYD